MHDVVGEVLAQRKVLDRGAGAGVALSLLLHAAISAAAVFAALRHPAEQSVSMIEIQFAKMPAAAPAAVPAAEAAAATPAPPQPQVVAPVPKAVAKVPPKTVPLSPFGKSTKKGAEPLSIPATQPPAIEIPVGGTGAIVEGDFPYTIYIDRMKTLIGQHWFRPQATPGITTTVKFVIDRDGTIHDAANEADSGNGTFDRAALRAVIESSPLPPLPFGYSGTYLNVHLTFK
jgi:TonB family protein